MVAVAGSYEEQGAVIFQAEKTTGAGITKGDVCSLSSNKWVTAPTSAKGPFAVCIKTAASADTVVNLIKFGIVQLTADGTINPNSYIKVSGSTAGRVVAATAVETYDAIVGSYWAHETEGDGSTVPVASSTGDVIRCFLGGP